MRKNLSLMKFFPFLDKYKRLIEKRMQEKFTKLISVL